MLARRAAAAAIVSELKTTVAGLLLQSQLAVSSSEVPPSLADKLRVMAELAGSLRQQLSATSAAAALARRDSMA
jgi:2-keto-4-pentenoate hydratase